MSSEESEIIFCMIPFKEPDGKVGIFPHPQNVCHCRNLDTKHFCLYGRYNKERTGIIPSSDCDVSTLKEYIKTIQDK